MEGPRAAVAGVRPLARVGRHVSFEIPLEAKSFPARRATERLPRRVGHHVNFKVRVQVEVSAADVALERFVARFGLRRLRLAGRVKNKPMAAA